MEERNVKVDHSTINRWVIEYAPKLETEFRKHHKRQVNGSWRMDETYLKVKDEGVLCVSWIVVSEVSSSRSI